MNNDHACLTMASDEGTTGGLFGTASRPADKTAALTRVQYLEAALFDDGGRVRRGITRDRVHETVALINHLRRNLGWLEIDLDGRWRWPATSDRPCGSMAGTLSSNQGGRRGDQANQPDRL